jgi:hypothetical protein
LAGAGGLVVVDLLAVPHAVEGNFVAEHIVPHAVRPDLEAPLADALPFELLDLWWRAERVGLQTLDSFQDSFLGGNGKSLEVPLKAGSQEGIQATGHRLSGASRRNTSFEIVLKADSLSGPILSRRDSEALLRLRI